MNVSITLTSKRQATFPAEVCEGLGVAPGDKIDLIPKIENGEKLWLLKKHQAPSRPWLGQLSQYSKNAASHSIEDIRESIRSQRKV